MKKRILVIAALVASVQLGSAAVLSEDFEAAFPGWESGWFAVNSNAQNYYGVGQDRGNNPDGLWIQDDTQSDQNIRIAFNNALALTLTSFSLDVAGYSSGLRLEFFDASGSILSDSLVTLTNGAYTDPGSYSNFSVLSGSGIGGFRLYGGSPEGNTSIDNLVANGTANNAVPEPATWMTLAPLLSIAMLFKRSRMRV